jgi:hypothetical protein
MSSVRFSLAVRLGVAFPIMSVMLWTVVLPTNAAVRKEALAGVDVNANLIVFQPSIPYSSVRVTVSGPAGFETIEIFAADQTPMVELPGHDGLYKYELRFAPELDERTREMLAAARRAGTEPAEIGTDSADARVQSGAFTIADGALVPSREEAVAKAVLSNGDGVIRNSLCIGFDCPDAPLFGDSTVLLMENNTRIKFGDTSSSPFPNNDWEIEANSNLSGGVNYLGFNDCGSADNDGGCAADLVFAVESGARQSALYVERDGDVGLGTSNPVLDLHIVTGDTPAVRLDQDGTSGFAPQVWDIAGNEANFFVRDVTGGSRLPFRIRPGAPTSSIDIAADGDVGIGTADPGADLEIRTSETFTFFRLAATGASPNTAADMTFSDGGASGMYRINIVDGDPWEFQVDHNGNVTIKGGLITSAGGGACTVGDPCDRVFHPGYELPSIEQHAASMWKNQYLPAVGPTLPDQPVNLTEKTLGMLNELEKAHIYIELLHSELEAKEAELAQIRSQLDLLTAAVAERSAADVETASMLAIVSRLEQRLAALEAAGAAAR